MPEYIPIIVAAIGAGAGVTETVLKDQAAGSNTTAQIKAAQQAQLESQNASDLAQKKAVIASGEQDFSTLQSQTGGAVSPTYISAVSGEQTGQAAGSNPNIWQIIQQAALGTGTPGGGGNLSGGNS